MPALALLCALTAIHLSEHASARGIYVARVPNGANVVGINALGHIATTGGGTRNQFGLDFAAAGREWTPALCALDSDGDGQTNGQELGDPCCKWNATSNAVVVWTTGVSAPGNAALTSNASLWVSINCSPATPTPTPTTSNSNSTNTNATTTNSTSINSTIVPTTTPSTMSAGRRSLPSAAGVVLATGMLLVALGAGF